MPTLMEPLAPWLRDLNRLFSADVSTIPAFLPPADLLVDEQGVTVIMDVPGLSAGDIEIELENDTLAIRGERTFPYDTENGPAVRRIERGFGRFERSLAVPGGLDADAVNASLTDGVLTLRVPRPESTKPQRVEIQGSSETQQLEGQPS
jgi:HSP20 family protein